MKGRARRRGDGTGEEEEGGPSVDCGESRGRGSMGRPSTPLWCPPLPPALPLPPRSASAPEDGGVVELLTSMHSTPLPHCIAATRCDTAAESSSTSSLTYSTSFLHVSTGQPTPFSGRPHCGSIHFFHPLVKDHPRSQWSRWWSRGFVLPPPLPCRASPRRPPVSSALPHTIAHCTPHYTSTHCCRSDGWMNRLCEC